MLTAGSATNSNAAFVRTPPAEAQHATGRVKNRNGRRAHEHQRSAQSEDTAGRATQQRVVDQYGSRWVGRRVRVQIRLIRGERTQPLALGVDRDRLVVVLLARAVERMAEGRVEASLTEVSQDDETGADPCGRASRRPQCEPDQSDGSHSEGDATCVELGAVEDRDLERRRRARVVPARTSAKLTHHALARIRASQKMRRAMRRSQSAACRPPVGVSPVAAPDPAPAARPVLDRSLIGATVRCVVGRTGELEPAQDTAKRRPRARGRVARALE